MNIEQALTLAPHIIGELRGKTHPEHTTNTRTPKGPKKPAPANLTTIDDADTIYKHLLQAAFETQQTTGTLGLPANRGHVVELPSG